MGVRGGGVMGTLQTPVAVSLVNVVVFVFTWPKTSVGRSQTHVNDGSHSAPCLLW